MSSCRMTIKKAFTKGGKLLISGELDCRERHISIPKLKAVFHYKEKTRRMPVPLEKLYDEKYEFDYFYLLDKLFFHVKINSDVRLEFELWSDDEKIEIGEISVESDPGHGLSLKDGDLIISKKLARKKNFINIFELDKKAAIKRVVYTPIVHLLEFYFFIYKKFHRVKKNRISFMSGRRTELGGNMEFVWNEIKDEDGLELKTLFFKQTSMLNMLKVLHRFLYLYATSKVIVVDDFFRLLNTFKRPKETRIFQLWHACGAFKTFGYSRLGKPGGPHQYDKNHRMYDCAIVSSKEISRHYAEGFGISDECVFASGIPRTDIFFDQEYKEQIKADLYERFPSLKDKKILLFAPTFRGNGQVTAYYDIERINVNELKRSLGDDWAIIIKLHPFCKERFIIAEEFEDSIIDLSNMDELNDLLFITDLLVTDYSSCIFEASLLNIPMLFYVYDLDEYIRDRDFYYEFEPFAPGKIVKTENELYNCVKNHDYEDYKIKDFKKKFFDNTDGKSTQRVTNKILSVVRGEI